MLFSINNPDPAKGVYWGYTRETGKGIYIKLYINPEIRSRSPLLDYLAIIIVLVPLFLLILSQNERISLFLLHLAQVLRFHVHLRG
ncbi:hypothetical protein COL05_30425 [Bacillus sp. AFS059628]|nr:hypothetical protein COL05_30425 [Bacillus sp. AFS059628]